MTLTNYPNGITSFGIPQFGNGDIPTMLGSVFFVDSATGSAANNGLDKANALATIDGAVNKCTASKGDVIIVLPGHSETLTAAITCDIAGITIIGLGEGTLRPQLTVGGVIDGITITADNVTIDNLYFNEATAAATANINIAAANAKLRRIHMDCGTNDVDVITVTATGELPTIEDCTVLITANGPDSWVKFEGVIDRPIIRRNVIVGSDGTNPYDDGVLDFNSQAVTNPAVYGNVFNGGNQTVTVVANGASVVAAVYGPNVYAGSATNADNVVSISAVSLAADSIGASEIATGAIAADAFAAGAIDAAAIANGAIDAATFAAGAIDAAAIANNAIDATAIADDAIDLSSIADDLRAEIRGSALNYNATGYLAVTADMTSATWNTQAVHEVFTVTGMVRMRMLIECTGTLEDAADGASIQFGYEGATNGIITTTQAAGAGGNTITAGEIWLDATPADTVTAFSSAVLDRVVPGGLDVGYEITGAALTGGALVFHCWWEPLNATGAVAARAGGVL
jgi:hypothetical protein